MSNSITIPLSKTGKYAGKYEAIVDDCDADLAIFNWSVLSAENPYAIRKINRKQKSMHVIIMERMRDGKPLEKGQMVDHVNMNTLDNRRTNLRIVTKRQNMLNRGKPKSNTSGHKNIYWATRERLYVVKLKIDGKNKTIGYFHDIDVAIQERDRAITKYFGEFGRKE